MGLESNHVPTRQGLHVYRSGSTGSRRAELVKTRRDCSLTNAAGCAFWSQRVYKMQPLTGFGTSVDEHWKCRPSTSRRSQSARFGFLDAIGYTELVLMDAYVSD